MLKSGQFTSLITNFEKQSLNSVKVYKEKDLKVYDKETKQMRSINEIKKSNESQSSLLDDDSKSFIDSSNSSVKSDAGLNKPPKDRLFIGLIDINKCEEDF